jgi:hypothetical protein
MLQTPATGPTSHKIELLELIEEAHRHDIEPRLAHYLHHCRRTGYEPPAELLQLARDHIKRLHPTEPPQRFRRRASDLAPTTLDSSGPN